MFLNRISFITVRSIRTRVHKHLNKAPKMTPIVETESHYEHQFWQDDLIEETLDGKSNKINESLTRKSKIKCKEVSNKSNVKITSITNKFHNKELLDFSCLLDFSIKHSVEGQICPENQFERLIDNVLPLWHIPYQDQLNMKQNHMSNILKELKKKTKIQRKLTEFSIGKTTESLMPCELEPIRYSSKTTQYRNCSEFSVNVGIDGNPKTVGFYVGKPRNNDVICVPPSELPNLKNSHKLVAKHFQDFIRSMPYTTCLHYEKGGVWKNILVRSTEDGQMMIVAIINPRELEMEQIEEIQENFKNYFLNGPAKECGATSILFQCSLNTRSFGDEAPFKLLFGHPFLVEPVNEQTFVIRPDSFFQTNTNASIVLFNAVKELIGSQPHATVLDTCCGTGVMGMQVAQCVQSVIGIDSVSSSIEDAKINAEENELKNCVFFHGTIDKMLPKLIVDFEHVSEVIAIVNPPKNGLSRNVVNLLRDCPVIRKIIYISCRPAYASHNFELLCKKIKKPVTKKKLPPPFKPTYAIPIDMFPHTPYVELVVMFERNEKYII